MQLYERQMCDGAFWRTKRVGWRRNLHGLDRTRFDFLAHYARGTYPGGGGLDPAEETEFQALINKAERTT